MAKRKPVRSYRPGEAARQASPAAPHQRARAEGATTAVSPGWRGRLERFSVGPLIALGRLPTFVMPVTLMVIMLVGLVLPAPWSGSLLVMVGVFLTWIMAVSWPVTSVSGRVVRVLANLAIIGAGVAKMLGAF